MRNYIVINGIKSDSVNGLIIQSLPPISKPKMRTSVEEIDGRDGDIITRLGYSAYDKEVKIGLYGDYDVDDAIQFFDSNGKVVFSNEPDKYYNFDILDQIDFERLIRFKTATVKFHVQPFKYSDVDRVLRFDNNLIEPKNFSAGSNGIAANVVTSNDTKVVSLIGTSTQATEFYVPINPFKVENHEYTLQATSTGTVNGSYVRLIADSPKNSFVGSALTLKDNSTATGYVASPDTTLTYNYLWFYIPKGTVLNATIAVALKNKTANNISVVNRGNIISRPKITVYGSGMVDLYINSKIALSVDVNDKYITIDSEKMNAYHDGTLKNRNVYGDPSKLFLNIGKNVVSWSGSVDGVVVENFSRWI